MQHAHRNQPVGDARHQPQRLKHDAHGPEEVHERWIGAVAPVAVADQVPGEFAVQEILQRQAAAGLQFQRNRAHGRQHLGPAFGSAVMRLQRLQELPGLGQGFGMAARGRGLDVGVQGVKEEMLLEVHHVGRQRVAEIAIVLAPASQEDDGETVLGIGLQDLVDPAGHAAADIGKRALQQQRDVRTGRRGELARTAHEALQ